MHADFDRHRREGRMKLRWVILALVSTLLSGMIECRSSLAQLDSSWNGLWSGSWGGTAPTFVTIRDGKVAAYEYKGNPVAFTASKIEDDKVTFGIANNYAIHIVRTGPSSAKAF